jgi:hypothetical protein
MNDTPPAAESDPATGPVTYHIMLRADGAADFRRAGSIRLAAQPPRGSVIEVTSDGRTLRGFVAAVFIPPDCEENCIGTVFLVEA